MASKDKSTGAPADDKPAKTGRIAQIRQTYTITKASDPRIGWILLGLFVGVFAVVLLLGFLFGARGWGFTFWVLLGFMLALLTVTVVFGRRAERSAYAQIEGQPGAAAAVLQTLRGGFTTTPMVAVTKNQDIVHRVVGKCGIVLVAEGPPTRAGSLLANEKKKTARWVPDIPIHDIMCGDGEGQVTLQKLNRTVMKLPRTLRAPEVTAVKRRLEAVASVQSPLPIPKGPMPKGAKMPRPPRG
jgi:F0F1-type ATP synthase assembly protein I